eukprot:TRINITY_DN78_c0_g1_i7.p1 TRINITY_DN78_c0_g1~~TRINITY_DN78_c0_g1_i7.p1  ORF type:complete len:455 (-),score=103.36 TRINITY_DN78_c0_g1_i7:130-1494(-)
MSSSETSFVRLGGAGGLDTGADEFGPSPSKSRCPCCCAPADPSRKGCLYLWCRCSPLGRCGIVFLSVLVVLSAAWGIFCAASLCCYQPKCPDLPSFPNGHPASKIPVIFTHGFLGSRLMRNGQDIYGHGSMFLGLDQPDLGLPLTWTGDVDDVYSLKQDSDGASASSLDQIKFASCIRHDVYGYFMSWGSSCMNRPFYTYVYDWRRDDFESALGLSKLLQEVSRKHNSTVQLIGHSNGGLLSAIVLNLNTSLIHSVVFAATPFGGFMCAPGLQQGLPLALNTKSLDAQRFTSISAPYTFMALLPSDQEDPAAGRLITTSGQPLRLNLSDPEVWLATKYAPVIKDRFDPYFAHLNRTIKRAVLARQHSRGWPNKSYPPIAWVASESHDTVKDCYIGSQTSDFKYEKLGYVKGDDTVTFEAARPPFPAKTLVKTDRVHDQVMGDVNAIFHAMNSLF